jgi:hypothetical protein
MEEQSMKSFKKQIGGNHYKTLSIQPSKYIYYNQFNWYQGNVIKYVSRYNRKHKTAKGQLVDLRKAEHYLQLLIETFNNKK